MTEPRIQYAKTSVRVKYRLLDAGLQSGESQVIICEANRLYPHG